MILRRGGISIRAASVEDPLLALHQIVLPKEKIDHVHGTRKTKINRRNPLLSSRICTKTIFDRDLAAFLKKVMMINLCPIILCTKRNIVPSIKLMKKNAEKKWRSSEKMPRSYSRCEKAHKTKKKSQIKRKTMMKELLTFVRICYME